MVDCDLCGKPIKEKNIGTKSHANYHYACYLKWTETKTDNLLDVSFGEG